MKTNKTDLLDNLVNDWKKERPDLDASSMLIIGRILKLGKILEKSANSALLKNNITYTDLDVLATLRRSGKPYSLTPKQLMQSVLITSGAMTALLNRLMKLNLIYRSPDLHDGRIKRAGLTKKGVDLIDEAIETRFYEANESVKMFTTKEKEVLSNLLKKMNLYFENL
jgi:DNA-binding MarR family transcriptional regulator